MDGHGFKVSEIYCICTSYASAPILSTDGSKCLLLEAFDLPCDALHVVIIDIWYPLKHYLASISGCRYKFSAGFPHDVDRVVIMVVSDQAFRLVGCPTDDILGHVYTCGVCVPSLDCIFAISPDSSDRITEDEFLKTPFPE